MSPDATVRGVGVSVDDGGDRTPVVMLDVGESVVPIFVSDDQAQSIRLALEGGSFERPLTHDLLLEMTAEFGAAVDRVRIDDLSEVTFFAKIETEQYRDGERRTLSFDARPSDAIALALRLDCPIEVSPAVVDRAGRPSSSSA
ncbi:bifunctional nuclease family protein [Halomarina oriensis]|uniref:Bifunctional nuclease family protein n=1 Tax=Halomarina oriensis TaxID=671145 RepID=A0A6B0GPP5_9EURY|nr:bifunctional nuclease family protein [Halomarina oriensis]MWG36700.1 bifunctional nuclease family protein [Halomarina oriensis]